MAHSLKVDLATEEVLFYGEDQSEGAIVRYNPYRYGSFVNAEQYGAVPDGSDVTEAIQFALDNAPEGSVLLFVPGTYSITNGVSNSRNINILAYGVTFDLGANSPSTGYTLRVGSTDSSIQQISIRGLTVQRTVAYTGTPSSASADKYKYTGVKFLGIANATFYDMMSLGFEKGYVYSGQQAPNLGMQNTAFLHFLTKECRYGHYITNGNALGTSGGWANGLTWFRGRNMINTNTGLDKHALSPALHKAFWFHYPTGVSPSWSPSRSIPNDHSLYNVNLEGKWGRKVHVQGEDIYLHDCRYEDPNGGTDLEVEKVAFQSASGTGRNVVFDGGMGLDAVVLTNTNTVGGSVDVQRVHKNTTAHHDFSGGDYPSRITTDISCADVNAEKGRFFRASGSGPVVSSYDTSGAVERAYLASSVSDLTGPTDRLGGLVVNNTGGTRVNALAIDNSDDDNWWMDYGLTVNKRMGSPGRFVVNGLVSPLFSVDPAQGQVDVWGDINVSGIVYGTLDEGGGSTQNLFETVQVDALSPVVADSPLDIFTFASGNNIALIASPASDKVTVGTTSDITVTGDLFHSGSNAGFQGTSPIAVPSAYTQTFGTTSRINLALFGTSLVNNTTGSPNTSVEAISGSGDDAEINNNFADLVAQMNNLRLDIDFSKRLLNSVIDDLQSYGLLQ